jgi:hypothetical protein
VGHAACGFGKKSNAGGTMKLARPSFLILISTLLICSVQIVVSRVPKAQAQTQTAISGELITLGAQGPALQSNDPLNTGPFNCTGYGDSGNVTMNYTMPMNMQLKGVLFFPGAWNRVVADFGWKLIDKSSGQVIYWTNWDHYPTQATNADGKTLGPGGPTVPQQVWFQLPAGTWITLKQGDVIELQAYCNDFSNYGFVVKAHVAATLYGVGF